MEQANVEAGLRQLSECLREIRALMAWGQLVKAEARHGTPPSFRLDHRIDEDLRVQSGLFMKTAMDLHEVLPEAKNHGARDEALSRWKKRLRELETEFSKLDLTVTFIKA